MSDEYKEKTLCALQEEGFIGSNTDAFIELIRGAGYYCGNCGRSAVDPENLCNANPID
jgi:hypothetical protein